MITDAGLQAIGVDPAEGAATEQTEGKPRPKRSKPAKPQAKGGRKTKTKASPQGIRPGTKQALLIDLLSRKSGATLAEMVEGTGWQAHSVRGVISGWIKKKLDLAVASETVDGRGRVYRIAARS